MVLRDNWFSAAAEADNGAPIFINGRIDIEDFRTSGKFQERLEIYWNYTPAYNHLPSDEEAKLMEEVLDLLKRAAEKDKLAILTGVYTGNDERTMVFYTRNSRAFGTLLNEQLKDLPLLPLQIYVEKDAQWNEYAEMLEAREYGE